MFTMLACSDFTRNFGYLSGSRAAHHVVQRESSDIGSPFIKGVIDLPLPEEELALPVAE